MTAVVLDAAGGPIGGAARWGFELDQFIAAAPRSVIVIGRGRRLTGGWLLRRERLARGGETVVASNNASFAFAGQHRRVLLHNAMHFLYPAEARQFRRLVATLYPQIRVIRALCAFADLIVVPCGSMAARVIHHLPGTRGRIVVRHHPVTPVGARQPAADPYILVPVIRASYKNVDEQVRRLLAALARTRAPHRVVVTAAADELPSDIAGDPRVLAIGTLPHAQLARHWRSATAAFFPCVLEAFGYPLAEARAYGVPVLAADNEQSLEIAGPALRPYRLDSLDSLCQALDGLDEVVTADGAPFDGDGYFRWFLTLPPRTPAVSSGGDG